MGAGNEGSHAVAPGLLTGGAARSAALPGAGGPPPAAPGTAPLGADGKVAIPIATAINESLAHYNAGRLDPAWRIAAQILAARPQRADAHNLMGAILSAKGDLEGAAKSFAEATRLDPANCSFFANLGEVERQRGNLDAALAALTRAVDLDRHSSQALNNLGIVRFERREFEDAVKCYQAAIAEDRSYPEAHNNLGNALRALDRNEEALESYQSALLLRENYAEVYNNLAAILHERGDKAEAEHCYRRAIEIRPGYIEAYSNLAKLLAQESREDEALRVLGEALKIDDHSVITLVQVARVQLSLGNHVPAEQAARLAVQHGPSNADAEIALGEVMQDADRFPEALAAFEKAIAIKPDLSEARNLYGVCLKSVGRMSEAREQLLKALELNPNALGCYSNLADLEKFTREGPQLPAMETILKEASDPVADRYIPLYFALGKAYDDVGEHAKAISHFKIGAKLKRAKLKYDEAETLGFMDSVREVLNADFFAHPPFEGNPSPVPVFIVGMPRSGSTLVEQILSSHPKIFGAGEIKELSRRLTGLRGRFPLLPKYPQICLKMNREHYKLVSEGYLGMIRGLAPSAARITDKLLTNFYFAGLIHVMFPNAKIIHTKRNPVDTCWSSFTKLFKDDMPHSYDFEEMARYYHKYEELMQHWETVLPPGVLTTVVYEEVVADVEKAARAIIDFIGMPWDPACLAFHESSRPVRTASVVQVRMPVYTSSVDRWRRYGAEIQPLIDALDNRTA